MIKKITLLTIYISLIFASFSQNNSSDTLSKTIRFVDSENNEPLAYTLVINDGEIIGISDAEGYLDLSLLGCDSSIVMISNYGYEKKLIDCYELYKINQIKLTQKEHFLKAVDVTYVNVEPLFKQLKKQKKQKYYAQYYFKLQLFNEKHKLILFSDVLLNIYDTGKGNHFPYKLKFIAKRLVRTKRKKFDYFLNKFNVKNKVSQMLWLNKYRNNNFYEKAKFSISTMVSNDTTYLFLHNKNDTYAKNDAQMKIYNDTIVYFDYKYVFDEELFTTYVKGYNNGDVKSFYPKAKMFFNYLYFNVKYSDIDTMKFVPMQYNLLQKEERLQPNLPEDKVKYDAFYSETSMKLVKKLDLNLVKKVKFEKESRRVFDLIDSLPSTHPYLDTIPLPKIK